MAEGKCTGHPLSRSAQRISDCNKHVMSPLRRLTKIDETAAAAALGKSPAGENGAVETALDAFAVVANRLQGPIQVELGVVDLAGSAVIMKKG